MCVNQLYMLAYYILEQAKRDSKYIGLINLTEGSGCGSVGRAVASDTRGPRFESSHQQKFI